MVAICALEKHFTRILLCAGHHVDVFVMHLVSVGILVETSAQELVRPSVLRDASSQEAHHPHSSTGPHAQQTNSLEPQA